jgi:uncharacterized protein (TIGR00290 family)
VKEKILLAWSGGKDSCMTLYEMQKNHNCEIAALLTTITEGYNRISMHGVRAELVERQAECLGMPLHKVFIPKEATNDLYESRMEQALIQYKADSVSSVAFGDLFLEDVKSYRENNLARISMKGLFPLWKTDTRQLARNFVDVGFKAVVACVDSRVLDKSFVGKVIDDDFLRRLPAQVDPCGENGEFHSFVFDGPLFSDSVSFAVGEVVLRDSFWFCDLVPSS